MTLECNQLCKKFSSRTVIDHLSFQLGSERIHGIIGPNGAGKSTFFNLISGFAVLDSGSMRFGAQLLHTKKAFQLPALGVLRSFQVTSVFSEFTVFENVLFSFLSKEKENWSPASLNSFRILYRDKVLAVLQETFLAAEKDKIVKELSYGKKRLLELALTLPFAPKLLLLDEPFAGIGLDEIKRVSELIRKLSVSSQIMIVEHNLAVVAELCERVSVLHQGKMLAQGSYSEIAKNKEVRRAYLGED